MSAGNKGNKNRKYGRNTRKCADYAAAGKRVVNKKRRWAKLIRHWRKIGTPGLLAQAAMLEGKLNRREFGRSDYLKATK